jgi:hypothetical protein
MAKIIRRNNRRDDRYERRTDRGVGTLRSSRASRTSNRRREEETEVLEIEVKKRFLENMDDLAYDDGMSIEEVIEGLLEAYTYGDPNVDIDADDRVYFRAKPTTRRRD